jgi:hypothetical protein
MPFRLNRPIITVHFTSSACEGEPALGLDPRADALGSAIAAGRRSIPSTSRILRKHPHPRSPPQAGEGAHFRRRTNPISSHHAPISRRELRFAARVDASTSPAGLSHPRFQVGAESRLDRPCLLGRLFHRIHRPKEKPPAVSCRGFSLESFQTIEIRSYAERER